jgi:hypothetical protein
MMEFEIVASRVALLKDGLMVLVTVPNEFYQIVMSEKKSVDIKAIPEPGIVIVKVGRVIIRLTPTVFEHIVEAGKIFVYLSDYDSYVMEPWVEGTINAAELWTVKGVADYLATQTASDSLAVVPVVGQIPENGVVAMTATTESG